MPLDRYVHLKGFLSEEEQLKLSSSTFRRHHVVCNEEASCKGQGDNEWISLLDSVTSMRLDMGLQGTGGRFIDMEVAVTFAKRAFKYASNYYSSQGGKEMSEAIRILCEDSVGLTGLSLLYGPNGKMLAHHDSPTQPGRRDEWLCSFSIGATTYFRCNDEVIELQSGDALVMDSMAVLHGVESIGSWPEHIDFKSKFGLPISGSRLGVLLWKSADDNASSLTLKERISENQDHEFDIKCLFVTDSDTDCSD